MKLRNIYMACKRSIEPISNIRFIQKKSAQHNIVLVVGIPHKPQY